MIEAGHPRYAVVGCLTIDSVATATDELIPLTCGGNGLYGAIGVHIWDGSVGLVSRAGVDYPESCLAEISEAIDTSGIRRLERDHPVRVAFAYRSDGSRLRYVPEDRMAMIPEDVRKYFVDNTHDTAAYFAGTPSALDIPDEWMNQTMSVHVPPLLLRSHVALVDALRESLSERIITVDTPWSESVDHASTEHLDLLHRIDVTMPSEADMRTLLPDLPLLDCALWLIDHGAPAVVIKIGASGSLVADQSRVVTHVPAYPANAVDPTGAGDSFCGGFLVGLSETGDLVQAALYGTVAASFVVEDRHAIPVLKVTRREAEERLARIADMPRRVVRDPREASI